MIVCPYKPTYLTVCSIISCWAAARVISYKLGAASSVSAGLGNTFVYICNEQPQGIKRNYFFLS